MEIITCRIRQLSANIADASKTDYWTELLKKKYGIDVKFDKGVHDAYTLIRNVYYILNNIPTELVKACGINKLEFRSDMGPNKPYYPNHGYYKDHSVTLNADIFYHPDSPEDFIDDHGYYLTRAEQTILHEFGHGFDDNQGKEEDLSLQPAWTSLSGWSETQKPGLKRLVIKDPGMPEVIGEWWYDPQAKFTRFYAKKNPYDDWADTFSYYIAGMTDVIPSNKKAYFDKLLGKFFFSLTLPLFPRHFRHFIRNSINDFEERSLPKEVERAIDEVVEPSDPKHPPHKIESVEVVWHYEDGTTGRVKKLMQQGADSIFISNDQTSSIESNQNSGKGWAE